MGAEEKRNPFLAWKKELEVRVTELYDRFGRVISRGDLVIVPGDDQTIWQVMQVGPDLTPRADGPQGITMIKIVLAATRVNLAPGGVPQVALIKVADFTETELYRQEQAQAQQGPRATRQEPN